MAKDKEDEKDQKDESPEEAEDQDGESSEGEDGEGEGDGESGGGKKKLLIIIAAVVVLLLGVGAGLYFTGMLGGGSEEHAEDAEHGEAAEADSHGGGHDDGHGGGGGAFLEIPTMIVNLNTDGGAPRYLRLSVQLELENPAQSSAVEASMPRVIDQFQTYLRELRVKDLRGSAGIYRLQMELLWRVNQAAAPAKIKDVLFQEILIQ